MYEFAAVLLVISVCAMIVAVYYGGNLEAWIRAEWSGIKQETFDEPAPFTHEHPACMRLASKAVAARLRMDSLGIKRVIGRDPRAPWQKVITTEDLHPIKPTRPVIVLPTRGQRAH